MRIVRTLIIVLVLAFAMATAGCGEKTWSFDFTTATSLAGWALDENPGASSLGDPDWDLSGDGLELNKYGATAPVAFPGDFTMTVVFSLATDADSQLYFEANAIDELDFDDAVDYIQSEFNYVGLAGGEAWAVADGGDEVLNSAGNIPGLVRNGENTFKLVKIGDAVETWMNGSKISDFEADSVGPFFPMLYSELYGVDPGRICFESITVEYKGELIELD